MTSEDMRKPLQEARPYAKHSVIDILRTTGAVLDGHFVYTSGRHGEIYLEKMNVFTDPEATDEICLRFAQKYKDLDIDVVVGPAVGGINLSQGTARHLGRLKGEPVQSIFTEKERSKDGVEDQVFKRGYGKRVEGKKVLIVEDLTTTGGSVKKVVDAVRAAGGEVVLVGVMVNRDPDKVNSEVIRAPFDALEVFPAASYEELECQLCQSGVPVNTEVAHGKQFMEKKDLK